MQKKNKKVVYYNNQLSKEECKEVALALRESIESGATTNEQLEIVKNLKLEKFNRTKNPARKLRNLLKTQMFKDVWQEISKEREFQPKNECISIKKNKDGSTEKEVNVISPNGEIDISTDEKILSILGYDPKLFVLTSSSVKRSSWEMASKVEGTRTLYSFKINGTVRPIDVSKGEVSFEEVKDTLLKIIKKGEKPIKYKRTSQIGIEKKIAIVNVADLHLGKMAWGDECGESYDYSIATKRFNKIILESVKRLTLEENIEKIVFFWSQDFFHYDRMEQVTTAGTFQQTDMRWQKMFMVGTELLVSAIDSLKAIADVETFYTRSNHDEQTGFYANALLAAKYEFDTQVSVDVSPAPRKYVEFGVNLLGFAHGDKEGKRIGSMMQIQEPEAWGRTKNREFFLGHFHSQRVFEENGIIFRYLSAPCGTDAWHNQCGFIGAQKGAQLFIRGEKSGQIAEYFIGLDDWN